MYTNLKTTKRVWRKHSRESESIFCTGMTTDHKLFISLLIIRNIGSVSKKSLRIFVTFQMF